PGNDFNNPDFGGDIKLISGSTVTSGASLGSPPSAYGRTSLDNGVNVLSALFGTYSDLDPGVGVIIQNESPVTDVEYGSETNATLGPPIPTLAFRESLLGPGANISTNIKGAGNLIEYAQAMINEQSQQIV